jgi:hypothetical protein
VFNQEHKDHHWARWKLARDRWGDVMAKNLLSETWLNLDSDELFLLLKERIGGPGQFDGRDANPNKFYLPLARDSFWL